MAFEHSRRRLKGESNRTASSATLVIRVSQTWRFGLTRALSALGLRAVLGLGFVASGFDLCIAGKEKT